MDSPAPLHFPSPLDDPLRQAVSIERVSAPHAAANDGSAREPEPNDLRNPLWIVTFGMAFLFGVMVLGVAFS